ncbi:MAG: carbamoyltransferase HypF [Fidelibacterota bacterium]
MGGTGNYQTNLIKVYGIVQGVGFRPFVYKLARELKLPGYVLNDSEGVKIHLQCNAASVKKFLDKLQSETPPRSRITNITTEQYTHDQSFHNFSIHFSDDTNSKTAQVSPDLDVCEDCYNELFDKSDRRYLYPFINCTNCGPRFTITQDIPYDRKNTTMKPFIMCASCQAEYDDPVNRRFHAQPNGCHDCGPQLQLVDNTGKNLIAGSDMTEVDHIFNKITNFIANGEIIAIKGIGGFHLACDALNETAVRTLRMRKYREDNPFAVMFSNIEQIETWCEISDHEKQLLTDVQHPIVLLKIKQRVAESVAPGNHFLGCLLPYSPVHHLLMNYCDRPLVMTSGNKSDEPVKYDNQIALDQLGGIADYFLLNNRDINIRCDDSVIRSYKNAPYAIRRSRGYVPADLQLDYSFSKAILACGAEQKNVFALAKNQQVYLSHHIGDLKNYAVLKAFETGIDHFQNIFEIGPVIIAVDKHPDYLSTHYGIETAQSQGINLVRVQHHHAHAAACMAENQLNEPVLALILDGTGYGNDETIWGGECLLCDYKQSQRIGHLRQVKMPGGDRAVRNIGAMGLAYLYKTFGEETRSLDLPFLSRIEDKELVLQMLKKGINSPVTSSCGRLFDGFAAIAGFRARVNYEGQAAIEFEQQIDSVTDATYNFNITANDECDILDWEPAIRELIVDIHTRKSFAEISEKFHNGLTAALYKLLKRARKKYKINKVVLSGGVFMNLFLLKNLENKLLNDNFKVYTHKKVPANDGGIALGQLFIADHQINM